MADNYDFELKIFSQKLLEYKERKHLSYQDIADDLGANKSHIQRVATMETAPSLSLLAQIAAYMNLPLFALFVPSNEMIRQHFADQINNKLSGLQIDALELSEKTGIPLLRLKDILQGTTSPSKEEYHQLVSLLEIVEEIYTVETKEPLLRNLLSGMDLRESQIENILEYIKSQKS